MKCPPQSLFISALYPACFLHFDFSSISCPPHSVFLPLCIPSEVWFAILLMYILKMHGRHFMLIAPLLQGLFRPLSLTSVSLSPFSRPFLFPPSSAGTWTATWRPGDKCWCVSRVWPRWPVAGSHQTAHQRGICPRCQSGPCGHLLRLCAQEQHTGVNTHLQAHTNTT